MFSPYFFQMTPIGGKRDISSTKVKSAPNRPNSYTANVDSHSQNVTVTDEAQYQNVTVTDEAQYQNVTATVSKCYSDSIKMLPNNKDNNKKNNKDNYLPTNCYALEELRSIPIGERLVRMTIHQYANLLRAVGVLPTLISFKFDKSNGGDAKIKHLHSFFIRCSLGCDSPPEKLIYYRSAIISLRECGSSSL